MQGIVQGLGDIGEGVVTLDAGREEVVVDPVPGTVLAVFRRPRADDDLTYLLTVSTSAYEDDIAEVEDAADTVLMTIMEGATLDLYGFRSDSVTVSTDEIDVPFTEEQLGQIKPVAEETGDSIILTIKEI